MTRHDERRQRVRQKTERQVILRGRWQDMTRKDGTLKEKLYWEEDDRIWQEKTEGKPKLWETSYTERKMTLYEERRQRVRQNTDNKLNWDWMIGHVFLKGREIKRKGHDIKKGKQDYYSLRHANIIVEDEYVILRGIWEEGW